MYVIVTYLVLAALIIAVGVALFVGSIAFVLAETGAQAIARSARTHAHALAHVRLRPEEPPRRNEMHA